MAIRYRIKRQDNPYSVAKKTYGSQGYHPVVTRALQGRSMRPGGVLTLPGGTGPSVPYWQRAADNPYPQPEKGPGHVGRSSQAWRGPDTLNIYGDRVAGKPYRRTGALNTIPYYLANPEHPEYVDPATIPQATIPYWQLATVKPGQPKTMKRTPEPPTFTYNPWGEGPPPPPGYYENQAAPPSTGSSGLGNRFDPQGGGGYSGGGGYTPPNYSGGRGVARSRYQVGGAQAGTLPGGGGRRPQDLTNPARMGLVMWRL